LIYVYSMFYTEVPLLYMYDIALIYVFSMFYTVVPLL
jgi:hypothetical protein